MFDFNYYAPTDVYFGKNSLLNLGKSLKKYKAKKVLIHYGRESVIKNGLLDEVKSILEDSNIIYELLGGVMPNPRLSKVYEGIKLCREKNIDFILALGGGSVIDSAKAIGYGVLNDFDVWELYNHTKKAKASLPIGCILTIAAAGSEMSNSSVITNDETREKRGYNDNLCRPKFAIMDPSITYSLSPFQTACGIIDILMHTMERYFTNNGNMEITDKISEGLMSTVIKNAYILKENPNDYNARAEIMWASSLSHNGLTGCGNDGGDFSCHSLEHEMSGMFDIAHGEGLAIIWPTWARYVYKNCLDRFYKFAINVMGVSKDGNMEDIAIKGIDRLESFFHSINMPTNFTEAGIDLKEEQILKMASSCSKATGGKKGSAMVLYETDMANIYRLAK